MEEDEADSTGFLSVGTDRTVPSTYISQRIQEGGFGFPHPKCGSHLRAPEFEFQKILRGAYYQTHPLGVRL